MESNPIQSVVRARVAAMMAKYQEAESVTHMGMRGQLREKYLIEFFQDVIPQSYSITSGIICDASGLSSMQMDFIVANDALLPSLALHDDISIVPVEASLMTAEIKSTLHKQALDQVESQSKSISKLRYTNRQGQESIQLAEQKVLVPSIILAYDCKVSLDTLKDFLSRNPFVVGICVVGQFSLLKLNSSSSTFIEPSDEHGQYWETLVFVGKLYHALQDVAFGRAINPNWDQYMQGYK
ncbi:DUF6602 domain-containing protein [Neptuniibacter sp. QD37_6]|uniref:DUF6602 domain-containing protein n=1 Tax=Neptuniibacter sp. QD37_6 TaxID=3398210 RepID=UPI0039F49022